MTVLRPRLVTVLTALSLLLVAPGAAAAPWEPRIVKGTPTTTLSFPWQAQLLVGSRFLCGGALISPTVVLTAAHCLEGVTAPSAIQVSIGRDRTREGGVTQPAVSFTVNPGYQTARGGYDWAFVVLGTAAPAPYLPIQVAGPDETALWSPGRFATVTGYGRTIQDGSISTTLRRVRVRVLDDGVCERRASYGRGFESSAMLCAGDPEAGKDACQGDSGGPLVVRADDGSYRLVGIVSLGHGCAQPDFPGIYTRIADPALSAELVAQLGAQPATAGYPYLGSGGACVSASADADRAAQRVGAAARSARRAARRLDRAQRRLTASRLRARTHPSPAARREVRVAAAVRQRDGESSRRERRDLRRARDQDAAAARGVATACG